MNPTHPETLTEWFHGDGLSDETLIGEVRSHLGAGDVLGAQALACAITHPGIQEAAFDMLPLEVWHPTAQRVGWELYIYETGAVLAWHEVEGCEFPQQRTRLVSFAQAYAWAVFVGVWDTKALKLVSKHLTPQQAQDAGIVKSLPSPPQAADCKAHGLRNGDFVGFDSQVYQFVGVSLSGVVWMTDDPDKFVTQTRALHALKSRQLESLDSQRLESANDDAPTSPQLELFAS